MTARVVLTVLGVAPAEGAARVAAALGSGPIPVIVCRAGRIAGFAVRGRAWMDHRDELRSALGRAAAVSSFLPADPGRAVCDASAWPNVIAAASGPLADALARDGEAQQWDVTIMQSERRPCAADRAGLVRSALLSKALSVRLRGTRAGLVASLLMPRASTASMVAFLAEFPVRLDGTVTIEGPLPPLAFSAFRLERAESAALERAWAMLALRDRTDPTELARRWRGLAFALDPRRDGGRRCERRYREAGRAYGLLRGLAEGLGARAFRRDELFARCGRTVAVPTVGMSWAESRAMVPA